MNVWHEVEAGKPSNFNTIVEIPKDSKLKYELDKETGLLILDRAMYSSVAYPGNYGMVPKTLWDDGDPLDVLVISDYPIHPLTLVKTRPIGVMRMIDDGESDDKIIGVVTDDPRYDEIKDLSNLASHRVKEIKNFFETYKLLRNKEVEITKIEGKKQALEAVKKGLRQYKEKYD